MNAKDWYIRGMRDGIPIGLGYFAVSFTLGIASKKAGLSAAEAAVMSMAMLASAGQFAGIGMLAAGAGWAELVVTTVVVNMRYLLMSSALSQKVRQDQPFFHRFFMAYEVTDEIFGISMAVPGKLYPSYMYGAATAAVPGWVAGTFLGAVIGMILPESVMSALNVALYGMFMAVVIPPSRKSRIIAGVVVLSMAASWLWTVIPGLQEISSGFQMIALTILIAGAAAWLFPVQEKEAKDDGR
ncbi:MAG: AzlC family ABC transporter permease [Eubacteriales bacterium]|nr:AzlC family ABC transporter permease [Eubacteriales bacterium]